MSGHLHPRRRVGCAALFFLGAVCGLGAGLLWLVTLYRAYEAFQGKTFEIPHVTQFLQGQGWL